MLSQGRRVLENLTATKYVAGEYLSPIIVCPLRNVYRRFFGSAHSTSKCTRCTSSPSPVIRCRSTATHSWRSSPRPWPSLSPRVIPGFSLAFIHFLIVLLVTFGRDISLLFHVMCLVHLLVLFLVLRLQLSSSLKTFPHSFPQLFIHHLYFFALFFRL